MTSAICHWPQRPVQYQDPGTMWMGTIQGCGYEEVEIMGVVLGATILTYILILLCTLILYIFSSS